MSSVAGNHTIDLFCLLKENFKKFLFDLLITGRSLENLSSCFCHKDGDSQEYGRTHSETLNQNLLAQEYRGSPPNSSMLKIKRIFSLVISKPMSAFSL